MFEILTDWTVNGHTGLVSVMYFEELTGISQVRTDLNTFLTGLLGSLVTTTTYTIRTTGRQLQEEDGQILGIWSDGTARTGTGTAPQQSWSDSTQALIRWKTASVVGRRFLQGRTFIPGLAQNVVLNGDLTTTLVSDWSGKAQAFAAANNGFVIWHRPTPKAPPGTGNNADGRAESVVAGSVWKETAVLRRRRL